MKNYDLNDKIYNALNSLHISTMNVMPLVKDETTNCLSYAVEKLAVLKEQLNAILTEEISPIKEVSKDKYEIFIKGTYATRLGSPYIREEISVKDSTGLIVEQSVDLPKVNINSYKFEGTKITTLLNNINKTQHYVNEDGILKLVTLE